MNDRFKENISVKIVSLLIAIILWAYIVSDQNPKIVHYIKDVPVSLKNVETLEDYGLVIEGDQDYRVNIRLKGRRNDIFELDANQLEVYADLAGHTQKGINIVPVRIEGALDKFEQVTVTPSNIQVYLDEIINKQISIDIEYKNSLKSGYVKGTPKIKPSDIIVTGPSKIITSIEAAVVELDLKGSSEDIDTTLPVKLYDKQGKEIIDDVNISPSNTVDVTLPVIPTKSVRVEADFSGSLKEGYEIDEVVVKPSTVKLAGSLQRLDGIDFIKTYPINLNGRTEDFSVTVKPAVPDDTFLVDENKTVTVEVTVKETEIQKDFRISNIQYKNLADNLEVVESEDTDIIVTVKGKQNNVNALTTDDFKLYIDMSGIEAGTQQNFKINAENIADIEILKIQPDTITLEIIEKDQ